METKKVKSNKKPNSAVKSCAIVILNWNGKRYLEQFLPSVVEYSFCNGFNIEVIVADNGSEDGSIGYIEKNFKDVRLIKFDKNYGFTEGYNRALQQVIADYYLILNSDVLVTQGWLEPMLSFMEAEVHVAACMPKILSYANRQQFEYAGAAGGFIDFFGYPFCRGRILNVVENDNGQYNEPIPIFWASGACMLVRSSQFWMVGGFDNDFFAHMEEIDLCWRLKRNGYAIWCLPQSVVYHVGGGTLAATNPLKVYFNHRNNLVMLVKNLSRLSLIPVIFTRLVLDGASAAVYLLSGKPKFLLSVFKAHLHFYLSIPKTIQKRRSFKFSKISLYSNSIVYQYFVRKKRTFYVLPKV